MDIKETKIEEKLINNKWTQEEFEKDTTAFMVITFSVLLIITGICGILEVLGVNM
jgi:hypothetical protein